MTIEIIESAPRRTGRPPGKKNAPKAASQACPGVAPAPQYDRMRAPVWTANPAAPSRAGALNHTRIESRGYRC